jgi:hypothetical protein
VALNRRRLSTVFASALVVGLLGTADFLTAEAISFEVLFFAPVAFCAWSAGTASAFFVASFAVGAGMATELALGHWAAAPLASAWQAGSHFLAYAAVIAFISTRAALLERERLIGRLEQAKDEINTLRGLLPVCAWCARIRDDEREGRWEKLEVYVSQRSEARFTHGICPDCAEDLLAQVPPRGADFGSSPENDSATPKG